MNDKINKKKYRKYKTINLFYAFMRKIIGRNKFKRCKYNKKEIRDINYCNSTIYNAIKENIPFMACRFGDIELRTVVYTIENIIKGTCSYPKYIKEKMSLNAGFFNATDENLLKFGKLMLESCKEADLYGVWFNYLEDYIINTFSPNAENTILEFLEPYRSEKPWSGALKDKKVLVIHPFSETIEKQYLKKEKLFANKNILPTFKLITYKSIQTNAGGKCDYKDWFEALDKMYTDIKNIDFDVAIIGCGAYGFCLAAQIKKLNKVVIHLGGATQMLFGIRGKRWDDKKELQCLFNENWVRPSINERPKMADKVEGACYW